MTIKNYTPHALNIYRDGELVDSFESLGQIRLGEAVKVVDPTNDIPTVVKQYTDAEGLPEADKDTVLVVSIIVLNAFPERSDLRCPDTGPDSVVRDDAGCIIGVHRLQAI